MDPFEERYWRKVIVAGPDECWLWTAATNAKGYGVIGSPGNWRRLRIATHVALEFVGTPRPSIAHCALHRCDTPACVNPAHLWWGTKAENNRDMCAKGRNHPWKTGAPRGERNPAAKLTERDVRAIRASSEPRSALGAQYGVTSAMIGRIKTGLAWTHVT